MSLTTFPFHARNHRRENAPAAAGIHEDETAQRYGFSGALVPGIVLGAVLIDPLMDLWGKDWLERGTFELRNLRPAHDGEELEGSVEVLNHTFARLTITNKEGRLIADGSAEFPKEVAAPDPAGYPFRSFEDPLPLASPETLSVGQPLGGMRRVADDEMAVMLQARTGARWPAFRDGLIMHPLMFQQITTWDSIASFQYETPGIHAWGGVWHFASVPHGAMVETAGHIMKLYERKGHHYFDTEQLVTADGRPAALVRRSVIYKLRDGGRA